MCLFLILGMFVFGIVVLVRGRFLYTGRTVVQGKPARIIGMLLIAPLTLLFIVEAVLIIVAALAKQRETIEIVQTVGATLIAVIPIICLVSAFIIAGRTFQLVGKEPLPSQDTINRAMKLPVEYRDHFRSEVKNGDISDQTSSSQHPTESRVQE